MLSDQKMFWQKQSDTMGLNYDEVSVYLGVLLMLMGASLWVLQYTNSIFNGWGWSILYGSVFIVVGHLLLYSDVRVYIGNKSPTEELLTGDDF